MKIFGERVKISLKERGMTQRSLCAELKVLPSTLCEWLNDHNEPPMRTLVNIAEVLEVTTDYLLGLKEF